MAFEKIGLGGFLVFDEKQALRAMTRAKRGFADLRTGAVSVGKGIAQVGRGVRNTGLALLPVSIGLGLAVREAAGFESQMAAVGAVTRATKEDMALLTAEAKRQGVVSQFSAVESAQAQEFLGRAGFDAKESIAALGGVMNAAAAEGIGLAESADIISRVVKSMGREVTQAANTADILALASAKSNTSILALGESFSEGAPQAKTMGISVEETAAVFGKLADAGLRGSKGGTAFTNFLIKLSKPTKEANRLMKKWNITLTDSTGKLKPIATIVDLFKKEIDALPTVVEKARVSTEFFGIRGAKAFSALSTAGGKSLAKLVTQLENASDGIGAAAQAAKTRLDTFTGAITLLSSSVSILGIEMGSQFLAPFKTFIQNTTSGLNRVILSIQALQVARGDLTDNTAALAKIEEEQGRTAFLLAQGILDGIEAVKQGFDDMVVRLKSFGDTLKETIGEENLRGFAKFAVVAFTIAGVVAPLIVGFSAFAFVLQATLIPQIIGTSKVLFGLGKIGITALDGIGRATVAVGSSLVKFVVFLNGTSAAALATSIKMGILTAATTAWNFVLGITAVLLSPIGLIILVIVAVVGLLIGAFLLFRKENETIGETFGRIWDGIKSAILSVVKTISTTLLPIVTAVLSALGLLSVESENSLNKFISAAEKGTGFFGPTAAEPITEFAKRERAKFVPSFAEQERQQIGKLAEGVEGRGEVGRIQTKIAELGLEVNKDSVMVAQAVLKKQAEERAAEKADRKKAADKELEANVNVNTKTDLNIRNEMCVEGEAAAVASARHKQTIFERSGATSEPFIRRQARETGTIVPATARI